MVHDSLHLQCEYSRCNKNGRCVYNYPHPPNAFTQLDQRQRVNYRRSTHDGWIVPYSPPLLLLWEGHINVEAIFTVDVFLYIYKYLFKGPDHANFTLRSDNDESTPIDDYIRARYFSTCEAAWRILAFNITHQSPSVAHLAIHKPGTNHHQYRRSPSSTPSESSTLLRYFMRPTDVLFNDMLYSAYYEQFLLIARPTHDHDFPSKWWEEGYTVLNVPPNIVKRRSSGEKVARLQSVRPGMGESFYIHVLLFHHPAHSFEQL